MMRITNGLIAAAAFVFYAQPALGQSFEGGHSGTSAAAYYYITKPGEITIQVNLWGHVRNPGRYEVPISTDLIQLISFAGGPLVEANLGSVRITRGVSSRKVEFSMNLNHLDQLDDQSIRLQPGDTILIEASSFTFQAFVGVITTAAIITAAVANVLTASK